MSVTYMGAENIYGIFNLLRFLRCKMLGQGRLHSKFANLMLIAKVGQKKTKIKQP